ncbi:MAG: hypothetical protein HFI40_11645 [Lachnospiraceae bacterium]|jgi:hypothetical protein|nr:hypothetical protein [Lachnospiraceae bacterium]MCX4316608.1 DHHW family protein [Lachnospiraceae bacterium]
MKVSQKEKQPRDWHSIGMYLCLGILIFFMLTVLLRFFTRQVFVEFLGIENGFTRLVFIGAEEMGESIVKTEEETLKIEIDWKERYPLPEENTLKGDNDWKKNFGKVRQWNRFAEALKEKITTYTGEGLLGYPLWVSLERQYEKAIRWNLFVYDGTNEVAFLPDGYLTHLYGRQETSELVSSSERLSSFCKEQGIGFLYVQSPFKVSKYQDKDFSGVLDFSNENADNLLKGLWERGISFWDIRETIESEGFSHHELFYRTDHHWKIETGLWAAGRLAEKLNEDFGFQIDTSCLAAEKFRSVLYEDWFLGSQGKKVTLERTDPEDICLLYPTYPTRLHYEIPDLGLDTEGDFSVVYNKTQIEERDYYTKSPYSAFNYGDCPVIQIENREKEKGHVLFIKDSFVNCVAPFLALGVQTVDVLDIRHFDGSVEGFIKEKNPDIVIVMYNPSSIGKIDWKSRYSTFDFR